MTTQYETALRQIRRTYSKLGHTLGWRFLYSPARTFNPKTRIVFIGLNPGGRRFGPAEPSVEEGNAYRVQPWGHGERLNSLQKQVCAFYSMLLKAVPGGDVAKLMDTTLSANFIPFRSASWARLRRRSESVQFARRLWTDILAFVRPDILVTMGSEVRHQIDSLLATRASVTRPASYRVTGAR